MVEWDATGTDLPVRPVQHLPRRRGPSPGPLRSLRRRQTIHPLMLAATVAVAVVSALALPSLLGRKPVLIAASPFEARVAAAPAVVANPAPLPALPVPIAQAAAAAVPDAPKMPPLPAMTASRPAPPVLTLDMLPVLTLAEDDAEAPKPPPRRNAAAQRRPDPSLRQATP